jgi:plasmid maintenance system antidote protein VapI
MKLTQGQLTEAMAISRKAVNGWCTNRRAITADTALVLTNATWVLREAIETNLGV